MCRTTLGIVNLQYISGVIINELQFSKPVSALGSSPVYESAQDLIIDCFPPSAIGRVLTADSIHRDQHHDHEDHDQGN